MKRTENMKFTDLSDYDYSEGETSEDMKIQSNSLSRPNSKSFLLQMGFHLPIQKQLEQVDPTFSGKNTVSKLPFPFPKENFIDNKDVIYTSDPEAEPVECVVFSMTRPVQYKLVKSDYVHERPPIVAWTEATPALDPKTLHSFYKQCYQSLRSQIRFLSHVPPSTEKFTQISAIRRDVPSGRIIFHYVGYGYPQMENGNIYASDPKTLMPSPCPLKNIFTSLKPPSWYIFDCNNAASALAVFEKAAKKMFEKNSQVPSSPISTTPAFLRQIKWDDYYCMCATDVGEELPIDPRIPKDLLSVMLATPVPAAILFHILEFYRTSFPNPDFPFSHLKTVLAYESQEQINLLAILSSTIDAIAVETLETTEYIKLFRKDKTTSILFTNFILARFLLGPYDIHPQCYPQLPDMNRHPLWKQWQTAVDIWITSTLTPKPQLRTNYFYNALTTLEFLLKRNMCDKVSSGLLCVVCHAPFADASCSRAFALLAEYISKGDQYIHKLIIPFLYGQSAQRLCSFEIEITHPLSYILLSLCNTDPRLIGEISPLIDLSKLTKAIFDTSLCQETRALITAFIVMTMDRIRSARQLTSTKVFVDALIKAMKTAEPFLLSWYLMLFSTTFQHTPIELTQINDSALHLQVAAAVRHQSQEVRSAALLALASFLQPSDSAINGVLLMHTAPALCDPSCHVRHSLLMFLLRFIECENTNIINFYHEDIVNQNFLSFSEFLSTFIPRPQNTYHNEYLGYDGFDEFAKAVAEAQQSQNASININNLSIFMLKYLTNDPFAQISQKAKVAYAFTKKLVDGKVNEYYSDDSDVADSTDIDDPMSHDPFVFENILLNQLAATKLFAPHTYHEEAPPTPVVREYGTFDLPTAHPQLRAETKIPSKPLVSCSIPGSLGVAIASDDGSLRLYDGTFSYATEFKLGLICDCCSFTINNITYIAAINDVGNVTVINHNKMKILSYFSANITHNCSQHYFIRAQGRQVFVCTEDGIVSYWDGLSGLCKGEWSVNEPQAKPTAFNIHPTLEGVVIIGYDNGNVKGYDTLKNQEKPLILTLDAPVVSINGNDDGFVFIASSNGRVITWDANTNLMNTCGVKFQPGIKQFTIHRKLPFYVLSPPSEFPVICNPDLTVSHTFSSPVQQGSTFVINDEYPIICFIGENGDILSYNLIQ